MNNVMLDLEMLGVEPDGFICAIGAVTFDANGIASIFYDVIKSPEGNGTIDASTVFWWLRQSGGARSAFERDDESCPTLIRTLGAFSHWVKGTGAQFLWGNGAAEDCVWLHQAYKRNGIEPPLGFRQNMCYRTVKNLHSRPSDEPELTGTAHNALDDATWQALHLINMNARVGGLIL